MQKITATKFKGVVGGEDQRVALVFETKDGDVVVTLGAEQALETLMACLPAFNDAAFRGKSYRARLMATGLQWIDEASPGQLPCLRVYLGNHADNRLEIGVQLHLLPVIQEGTTAFVAELRRKGRLGRS